MQHTSQVKSLKSNGKGEGPVGAVAVGYKRFEKGGPWDREGWESDNL